MKKQIRELSDDGSSVQITIADERWYIKSQTDKDGNVTSIVEYPSVTWITEHYPKGIGYFKWLANQGWDESRALMEAAGNRGSKVHGAITDLLLGNRIEIDGKLPNSDTREPEEITLEEYEAIMSFADWFKETNPKPIENELVVFNEEYKYAGTADFICEIDGERWLIDFKTGQNIWPSYELQLSAYKHALPSELKPDKLAILQVGYARNRKRFKFTEIEDQFDLFLAARKIWEKECSTVTVFKKDYPVSISLN